MNHLDKEVLLDVCRDGTITFRKIGEPIFNGKALPFFSVDTVERARELQILLCKAQYEEHPKLPGQVWYRYHQFGGELGDIPALMDAFQKMNDTVDAQEKKADSTRYCTILERKNLTDDEEIVLCDRGDKVSPGRYVTWRRSVGTGATYFGRYFSNVMDAGVDFLKRTGQ